MDKDKNGARLAVLLLFMLIGAAIGSYFSSAAGNDRSFLFDPSSGGTVAAEAALLLLIFLCGCSPGGSLITLFLLAVKGFLLSAPVTLYIITNGTSSYPALGLRFCGGFLSALSSVLMGLRSIDMSVRKRYNGKTDASYFYAFVICAALCAAGIFITAKG